MAKEIKVNKKMSVNDIRNLHNEGYKLFCPHCNTELSVAFTLEEAKKNNTIPGVFCKNDTTHFYLHINLSDAINKILDKFIDGNI